jgi:hypothetical protein
MDRKLSEKAEIERLIRLSENARVCLENEATRIKQRFDIPARVRHSLSEHPTSWLFGSLASGLVASLFLPLRRNKPVEKPGRKGVAGMLLGLTLTAARPLAKVWLSNQAGRLLRQYSANPSNTNPAPQTRFP